MKYKPERQVEDEQLIQSYERTGNMTLELIAKEVGLSRERVRQRLILLGLKRYRQVLAGRRRRAHETERAGSEKVCLHCGKLFGPEPQEKLWEFRARGFCKASCQGRHDSSESRRRFTDDEMLAAIREYRNMNSIAEKLGVSRLGLTSRIGTMFIKFLWDVMDEVVVDEELQGWLNEGSRRG